MSTNIEIFALGVIPFYFAHKMFSYYFYKIFTFLYFIWFVFYFTYSFFSSLRRISFFTFHIKANSYIQGNEYIFKKIAYVFSYRILFRCQSSRSSHPYSFKHSKTILNI